MADAKRVAKIFNGTYTISSPRGEHRTFDIKTQPKDSNFRPGERIIALLTGPNNTNDYKSFGFVDDNGIRVFSKHRTAAQNGAYEMMAKMVWSLATLGEQSVFYNKGYRLLVEGTCIRCNRKLTTPESILSGIGPVCADR